MKQPSGLSSQPSPGFLLTLLSREVPALRPGTGEEDDLFDAGLDSMGIMHLLLALEAEAGIRVDAELLTRENFRTAASIARMLDRPQD